MPSPASATEAPREPLVHLHRPLNTAAWASADDEPSVVASRRSPQIEVLAACATWHFSQRSCRSRSGMCTSYGRLYMNTSMSPCPGLGSRVTRRSRPPMPKSASLSPRTLAATCRFSRVRQRTEDCGSSTQATVISGPGIGPWNTSLADHVLPGFACPTTRARAAPAVASPGSPSNGHTNPGSRRAMSQSPCRRGLGAGPRRLPKSLLGFATASAARKGRCRYARTCSL